MDDIRRPVRPAPNEPQPIDNPAASPEQTVQPAPDSPEAVIAQTPDQQKAQAKMNNKVSGRKKGPIIAIIIVIVLTLGLIAGAVYYYVQSQDEQTGVVEFIEEESTPNERLQTGEIDETIDVIDRELNTLDEANDFNANDLSEATIGL